MVKLNSKMQWAVSAFFAVLILFGTFNRIFAIVGFLGVCLLMFVCDRESILQQLFFIMPMANIFKMAPGSQSFFTIVLLLYVAMYFVLPRKATLLIVLFSFYIIIGQLASGGSFMLFRTVKLICNILFLSSVLNHKVQIDHKRIFFSYIIGNVVASCFGLLKDSSFFNIKAYVGEQGVEGIEFVDLTRFTGLHADPNYYTIGMIICLCLLVVMYHRNEVKPFFAMLLTVPIVYFLIITYSKSAILMLALPMLYLIYSLFKKKKIFSVLIILILAAFAVVLALSGQIEPVNVVLSRFEAASSTDEVDINSLTTGRFDLWITYSKYMLNHYFALFIGEGINAGLIGSHGSHNTYIQVFYYLGIVGGTLLILIFMAILSQSIMKKNKKTLLNYCVVFCMCVMYSFLGELFYFDPPFHIMLAFLTLNLSLELETKTKVIRDV